MHSWMTIITGLHDVPIADVGIYQTTTSIYVVCCQQFGPWLMSAVQQQTALCICTQWCRWKPDLVCVVLLQWKQPFKIMTTLLVTCLIGAYMHCACVGMYSSHLCDRFNPTHFRWLTVARVRRPWKSLQLIAQLFSEYAPGSMFNLKMEVALNPSSNVLAGKAGEVKCCCNALLTWRNHTTYAPDIFTSVEGNVQTQLCMYSTRPYTIREAGALCFVSGSFDEW